MKYVKDIQKFSQTNIQTVALQIYIQLLNKATENHF